MKLITKKYSEWRPKPFPCVEVYVLTEWFLFGFLRIKSKKELPNDVQINFYFTEEKQKKRKQTELENLINNIYFSLKRNRK